MFPKVLDGIRRCRGRVMYELPPKGTKSAQLPPLRFLTTDDSGAAGCQS